MNKEFWEKQRVFITGHTGFKGTWLCMMLRRLGATIYGYSNGYPTKPALFEQINGKELLELSYLGDILDYLTLRSALIHTKPTIVIHLAAQAIVKEGFLDPQKTFMINTIGTGNLLNACRDLPIEAILIVTTDKVYKIDPEVKWGYMEEDELGASDPYSTSKACAELVVDCYRKSFLKNIPIATARAGNVIGGGDWAYRVVPMIMEALMKNEAPPIWDPYAIRPWQSVLDCLSGYLRLIEFAYENPIEYSNAWNFGPDTDHFYTVGEVAKKICDLWNPPIEFNYAPCPITYNLNVDLRLDSIKAKKILGWKPKLNLDKTIEALVEWYGLYKFGANVREICEATLDYYETC